MPNCLGLDPANRCGWAYLDHKTHTTEFGTWKLRHTSDNHAGRRLERLRRNLFLFHRMRGIDVIGYEEAGFGSKLAKTQASHNELIGVIKLCAAELEIPTHGYVPTTLKKWFTGSGRASKEQMISVARNTYSFNVTSDDEADAIAVLERLKSDLKVR